MLPCCHAGQEECHADETGISNIIIYIYTVYNSNKRYMRQQHDDVDVKQGALSCRVFCLSHSLRLKSEILMSLQTLAQLGTAGHGWARFKASSMSEMS